MTRQIVQWRKVWEHQRQYARDVFTENAWAHTIQFVVSRDFETPVNNQIDTVQFAVWNHLTRRMYFTHGRVQRQE